MGRFFTDRLVSWISPIAGQIAPASIAPLRRAIAILTITVLTVLCLLTFTVLLASPTHGQIPFSSGQLLRSAQLDYTQVGNVNVGDIKLDGRTLFQVTAPIPDLADTEKTTSPIEQRVRAIDFHLNNIIKDGFDPSTLNVSYREIDNEIVIIASDRDWGPRRLFMVTSSDVEISSQQDAEVLAKEWSSTIQQALLQAHAQRQPQYQLRQIPPSLAILLLMVGSTILIWKFQKIRDSRYKKLKRLQEDLAVADSSRIIPVSSGETIPELQSVKQQEGMLRYLPQIGLEQQIVLYSVALEIVWASRIAIWFVGTALILVRFPQLRPLSNWLLRVPIGIIAIPIGVSLVRKAIDAIISMLVDRRAEYIKEKPGDNYRLGKRLISIKKVLEELTKYLALIAALILFFYVIGFLALGLILIFAIAFLSQNVFQDFLQTYFILFEDQYGLTDIVEIHDVNGSISRGTVENITLRSTQLRYIHTAGRGEFITISHSKIIKVTNLTRQWAQINLTIDVAYNTDLDRAMAVMQEVAEGVHRDLHWGQYFLEPPKVMGVIEFGDSGISIRLVMRTQANEQWNVEREYRRRLKPAFDRAGITIPFPQRSIWIEHDSKSLKTTDSER